jgi:hypothetical protein
MIPVTITHDDKPLDLTGTVIRCVNCHDTIEPIDAERGKLLPHTHSIDGSAAGIEIDFGGGKAMHLDAVLVRGLTKGEIEQRHPVGLGAVVLHAINRLPDIEIGPETTDLTPRFVAVAEEVVAWEREGCAQQIEEHAAAAARTLERMDEAHDCYIPTSVGVDTARQLAEEIRERDDGAPLATDRLNQWIEDHPDLRTASLTTVGGIIDVHEWRCALTNKGGANATTLEATGKGYTPTAAILDAFGRMEQLDEAAKQTEKFGI